MVIKNFLEPKTIAIIGASDEKGKVGYSLMKNLESFNGDVIPINLKHSFIFGKKAYKSVLDYSKNIDLAVIAIPSNFVLSILEDCGKKRIKEVIIISAGFSEIGKKEEEENMLSIAKHYQIRILGPNCFGVCNPYLNLDTTFALETPKRGDIAFISQSGALWSYISDFSESKFGFSGFVCLGNMSDLGFDDFIEYFSKDEKTKSIILYIEKLKNGKRFIEICKKCKKPIYAIKVGRSKKGSEAAISHTGSLATDFEVYKGAFKQSNVMLCNSLIECFEKATGRNLDRKRKLDIGKKTVIITNAGGAGALVTDYCESKGIQVIDWEEKNPLDLLGTATSKDYKEALEKLRNKDFYDSIIVILTPQKMTDIENVAEIITDFKKETKKNVIALFLGEKSMKKSNELFEKNKVQYLNTILS